MKILFLNYEFPPIGGGGANATYYLFKEFASFPELEIDLVTSAWGKGGSENFSPNIRIHKLEIGKKRLHNWTHREVLSYIYHTRQYIKKLSLKADLCHAFFGFPSGLIAYELRKNLPYIVSLRGSDVPGFNHHFNLEYVFLTPLFKKIWAKSRRVIANSVGLRDLAHKTAPHQEIGVIYNGIDVDEFKPQVRKNSGKINLIIVSRLIGRKGIDYLLRAMPEVIKKFPQITLTIIGEGNLEQHLQSLSADLGIAAGVSFLGFQEHSQMPRYYNNADIFILPSKNEGMSNTVLEAMACGLPIITTNTGGTGELIRGNGVIIPMENPQAIAEAVIRLISNPQERMMMGQKSREIALEFSWRQQALRYWEIYQQVGKLR
ncbi:MAG: glycosyltransferase family 4 protein [Candidatus Schekmanbacteria bacterium]|nr:glycosyltransferase family 4 protein [Candidatus Schekmanbacteria bacterium]